MASSTTSGASSARAWLPSGTRQWRYRLCVSNLEFNGYERAARRKRAGARHAPRPPRSGVRHFAVLRSRARASRSHLERRDERIEQRQVGRELRRAVSRELQSHIVGVGLIGAGEGIGVAARDLRCVSLERGM